jgi:predicted 2-oxoglutarate/Fe(II)-dependent dioxygenase YbiX
MIRDDGHRSLLFDLDLAIQRLGHELERKSRR